MELELEMILMLGTDTCQSAIRAFSLQQFVDDDGGRCGAAACYYMCTTCFLFCFDFAVCVYLCVLRNVRVLEILRTPIIVAVHPMERESKLK